MSVTFAEHAKAFGECVAIDRFSVFDRPDPAAKQFLDGFGSEYFTPFKGFTATS